MTKRTQQIQLARLKAWDKDITLSIPPEQNIRCQSCKHKHSEHSAIHPFDLTAQLCRRPTCRCLAYKPYVSPDLQPTYQLKPGVIIERRRPKLADQIAWAHKQVAIGKRIADKMEADGTLDAICAQAELTPSKEAIAELEKLALSDQPVKEDEKDEDRRNAIMDVVNFIKESNYEYRAAYYSSEVYQLFDYFDINIYEERKKGTNIDALIKELKERKKNRK